jgi:hypothetical protein
MWRGTQIKLFTHSKEKKVDEKKNDEFFIYFNANKKL